MTQAGGLTISPKSTPLNRARQARPTAVMRGGRSVAALQGAVRKMGQAISVTRSRRGSSNSETR
jgi:hypothetical protein